MPTTILGSALQQKSAIDTSCRCVGPRSYAPQPLVAQVSSNRDRERSLGPSKSIEEHEGGRWKLGRRCHERERGLLVGCFGSVVSHRRLRHSRAEMRRRTAAGKWRQPRARGSVRAGSGGDEGL